MNYEDLYNNVTRENFLAWLEAQNNDKYFCAGSTSSCPIACFFQDLFKTENVWASGYSIAYGPNHSKFFVPYPWIKSIIAIVDRRFTGEFLANALKTYIHVNGPYSYY